MVLGCGLFVEPRSATIGRKESAAAPAVFDTIWRHSLMDKESLSDYGVVKFSMLSVWH